MNLTETIVTRNGESGSTGCLNRNLYVMLKFTEPPKKNIAFPTNIRLDEHVLKTPFVFVFK